MWRDAARHRMHRGPRPHRANPRPSRPPTPTPYPVHAPHQASSRSEPNRRARPRPNSRPRHHPSFPHSAHLHATANAAPRLSRTSPRTFLATVVALPPPLPSSEMHRHDRELSALSPVTDRPVSIPIPLQQRRSAGCFSYPPRCSAQAIACTPATAMCAACWRRRARCAPTTTSPWSPRRRAGGRHGRSASGSSPALVAGFVLGDARNLDRRAVGEPGDEREAPAHCFDRPAQRRKQQVAALLEP